MKKGTILLLTLFMVWLGAVPAFAQNEANNSAVLVPVAPAGAPYYSQPQIPSGEAMVFDLFVVRPLAIAGWALGIGIGAVATPFALASGTTRPVYDRLLNEPYDFAFCRPLGAGF